MSIQLPTVHMNGTSKAELLETLGEASEALDAAFRAVKQTGPNGRDYYPQGPGEMTRAVTEHESRLRRIDDLKAEIEALLDGIHDGGARHDRATVPTPARRSDDPGKVYWTARIGVDRLWVIDGYCLESHGLTRVLSDDASFSRSGEIVAEIEGGPDRAECLEIAAEACEGDL